MVSCDVIVDETVVGSAVDDAPVCTVDVVEMTVVTSDVLFVDAIVVSTVVVIVSEKFSVVAVVLSTDIASPVLGDSVVYKVGSVVTSIVPVASVDCAAPVDCALAMLVIVNKTPMTHIVH